MRTFLTMFGIVWGIASVILLVGLGRGFSVDQKKHMQTLGKDLVIVWGGRTSSQVGGRAAGREIRLNVDDAELIRDECYLVKNVSPELQRAIPQVSQYNSANRGVVGMWPSYQEFRSLLLSEGRLINDDDEREERRVVVLGSKAYRQLFPGQPAIGAGILIKSVPYTVVGILQEKKQNSSYSGPDNDYLFAPYSAVSRDFPPPEKKGAGITRGYLDDIVFEVADPEEHKERCCKCAALWAACTTSTRSIKTRSSSGTRWKARSCWIRSSASLLFFSAAWPLSRCAWAASA
jgi:putative ABC transport system permease protein